MSPRILAVVIVVVILVAYFYASWNVSAYEEYFYGFWLADGDEFCEQSDIASMMLFVGEPQVSWGTVERLCYLIIMDDMCNQGMTIKYRRGWASASIGIYHIDAEVEFEEEQIWPEQVQIELNMLTGVLKIYQDDTVYALLSKQNDTTNASKILEDVELL